MGVEDRYKKKREESESLSTPYNGVENRYLLKDVKNVSSQITSRLDTWLKNHKNYISNAQNRFSTDGTAYRGGDAANWLAVVTNQNSSFQKEAENLKTLLNNYKDYFDKDYVSSVTKALDDNLDVQKRIVSASAEDLKYWSQFKDEDEYNQFVKESGYLGKYKGMTKEELDEQIAKLQSGSSGSPFENRGKAFVPNEEAKWIQDNYYQLLPYAPDFEEKSRYESTYRGGEKGKHFFSSTGGGYIYTDTGYDDIKYDYINKDPRAIDRQKLNDTETNQIFLGLDFGEVQEMTDEEISIFNYLYSLDTTEDKKEAYKYVEKYLQKDLDERERDKTERLLSLYARENPVSSSIASILFSPLKTISYVGQAIDYIDDGSINENASYNKHSYGNSAIRNEVSSMAANSWGPAGSFLYQTGMSMGDFLFTSLTTGGSSLAALPIMGMSSAADTVIASKDMGLSDNQAFWLGTAAGAIEVGTEKIGLDALFDTKALNGGAGKYILKNLLAEGAEEGLSNVGNTVAELIDLALTGDESKIRKEIAIIMQTEGLSESEAIGRYAGGKLQELGLDMLGGAISGGVLGAAGTGVNKMANAEEHKGMADHAQEYVTEALEIDPNNAYAQKLQKKLASGKTLSGSQLVKLVQQNEDTITSNDVAKIKTATANRLTELGETGNMEAIAAALTKYVQGETLTRAERTEIETSDFGQRVANELNPDNIKSGEYSSAWAEKIGTGRINAEEYSRILDSLESESTADSTTTAKEQLTAPKTSTTEISSAVETPQAIEATAQNPTEITQASAPQAKTVAETESVSAKETATEGENSASTGVDKGSATIKTGGKDVSVKVTDISSVNNGAIMLRLDNGETVNANEVNFSNEDVGIIYQAAADMSTSAGGFNADTVRVFAKGFDPSSGLTAAEYFHGFRNSYRYGAEGAPISVLTKDVYASKLSEELRNKAYHFGRAFGNEKAEQAQAKLESKKKSKVSDDKTKRKAKKEDHRAVTATNKETKTESPKTSYYDGDRAALTDRQRASVEFLEQVFGDRGIKFIFFASYTDENGRRVYKNGDGKVVPAPNGFINPDGSIMIDLNAGQGGEGLILNTASHELTHFIKDWSPTKYRTFAQFLLEQYLDKNVPIERYVQRKIDRAKENGRTIDRKVAYEEVVADSCEMMLVDIINNKNTENLQKLIVKDKSIFDKIKEFFTDLLERIKAVYKGVEPQTTEGAYIREMRDVADKLQTMWTDALVYATDTYEAISGSKTEIDSEVKFSLRENVEETKSLIAVHNLTEAKLLKSLELGGLPMPSIAIMKAQDGHNDFGEISLVFGKDTIDPKAYRSNKVYSGDAYTPTYPYVEYKLNEKAQEKVRDKINGLVSKDIQSALGKVHLDVDNLTNAMNRHGGDMATAFKHDYTMKYAYLLDEGISIELPMAEKPLSYYSKHDNGAIIKVAEAVSEDDLLKALNGSREDGDAVEPAIRKAVTEYLTGKYADKPQVLKALLPKEQLTFSDLDNYANEALNYLRNGLQQTVDYKAATQLINENIDQAKYEKWVKNLFSDIVEKEGIRNNKDLFTPSGNRRSFEALHYEHNLENVIKAMKENGAKGIGFGGGNIFGASTTEFGSVEEIKAAEERLQKMSQSEYDAIKKGFSDRFFELASNLPKHSDSFIARDDAANMLVEAVVKFSTKSGMANYLRRESEGWANYSDYIVDDLIELVRDIQSMPTSYFEAKPQRAVGFDEVATAIIPDSASDELKSKLNEWKIEFVEYESENDDSRLEALNSVEGVRFSDRDSEGNTLSKEQKEFFKDSKVRDADGNLLVVYHGTRKADFTKFNRNYNFFTDSEEMADSYSPNGERYTGYLNIKNPYIVDAEGEKWSRVPLDKETRLLLDKYGASTFEEDGILRTTPADIASAIEEGIYEGEFDYDGIIINNIDDTGSYYKSRDNNIANDYIAFNSNQFKNIDNKTPSDNPDIRYSDREFSGKFATDTLTSFKISKLNDYIHVQKQVFNTLLEEGFFINAETRSRTDANEESGMVIETNKSSISETFNQANFARVGKFKKIAKLATVRALPEIIKKGTLISDNVPNQYQNSTNKSFAYIAYDTVIDGVPITVKLDIKKSPSKNKLWVHSIVTEKNSTGLDVSSENGRGTPYRTDAIGGTISQNNENVNSKSLGSEDIRYSDREDFNELKRKLKEEYGVDTAEVLALSDEYLKNYGGVLNKTQFRMQFFDLIHEAVKQNTKQDGDVFGSLNEMVLDTATEIANNPTISGDLVDELRNIKRHIKDTRIKIPSVQKGDFDIFGGFEAFRRKHFNRLTLTKDGLDVDSVYPELQELFGYSWFPDNIDTVPDQLIRIAEVADMPLGEVTEIHYDSNDVAIDVAADILGKVKKIAIKASKNMARINYRNSDNISPRALLANALESVAQNDIEKNKLKSYRKKIAELNAEEQRLYEIQGRIKELSFATGPRDVAKIKSLRDEAAKSANRISVYDQQLLGLEASKPLKNVLQREKQKAYKKAAEEGREMLEKHKEHAVKTQEELKKRYQESRKRSAENRRMTEMRHKIKKVVSELNDLLIHESKNRNIKPGLQKAVASALEAIDVDTIRADERIAKYNALVAKYNEFIEQTTDEDVIASLSQARDNLQRSSDALGEKLEAMRKAYRNIREKDGTEYPDYYKEESKLIESRIEAVVDIVGNTPLRNMSYRQLDAVYDLYKMVLTTVRNANKVFKQGKLEELQENVDLVMTELSGRPKLPEERSAVRDVLRGYVLNELIPYYAFRKIGSKTFESFYWEAIKGQDVYARDVDDARDFASKTREKHHYSTWDFDKIHEFKLADGRTFSVSLKHMMSIYAYAKRNQARLHMQKGGFFFNDKETFRKKGGVLKMIRDSESSYKIDNDALSAIISTMTEEQRQYVDDMQAYMTKMGEKGNEVSQVLWGIDLFKEKIYFPLKSSKDFIYQSNQPVQESSLKNDGMTKETKPGASNPIVLEAFDDVWASHVNRMSQYHAFVLPIENLNKVINYGTWANNDAVSISTMLRSRYGSAVNDYLGQFIKDLNGVRSSQGAAIAALGGMLTKFKKNAVAGSLSVVVQQQTAILRAQALIDAKYFAHLPNTEKLSTRWAEVKKYAPIAIIKEIGGFDAGAGRRTTDWLNADTQKGLKKVSNAIDEATMWGAAKADEIGWCAIWEAVKRETLAKNKTLAPTSEEFLNLVGERFTEIIVKTQVYDSTLSRSGYMRSKNELVKMMTSFMGEPTVSINMLYDAVAQAKRGNVSKSKAVRTIGAVYLASVASSIAKSFVYALRDEDEDESYLEKYFQALGGSILDDINPLKWIPGVKDVLSIFDGWEVERTDMALFQDLKNAFDALNSDSKSAWQKTEDLAGAFAAFFGVPLKNVMRTAREVYNGFENMTDGITGGNIGKAFLEGITGKEASKSKSLYDAVVSDDKERLEVYRDDYKDEDVYNAALSKALRENDPRVKEAAQARQNGDVAKYTSIAKEIVGEGKFSQDNIVAAINSELRALKKVSEADNGETEKQTDADKAESIYLIDDFYMAIRGGDIATAYAVREDIVNVAIENGESREEAEKDFESNLTRYVQKQYNDAVIGDKEATDMLTTYGSKTETEAASKIRYWAFSLEYPEYEDISESAINKYYDGSYKDGKLYGESAESYGISLEIYAEYIRGKTGLTQKEDIMYIINTLPLTSRQKDALYYLNNWAKSTIKEAPWR